jgi:DNA-binding protein
MNNFLSRIIYCGFFKQKILGEYGEVRLSGLGVAMSSLVTVAEILKSRGLVTEKNIITSLEELDSDDGSG